MTSIAVVTVIGIAGTLWHEEVGRSIAEEVQATPGAEWAVVCVGTTTRDFPDSHAPDTIITMPRPTSIGLARRTALHTSKAEWVTYVDDALLLPGSLKTRLDIIEEELWSAGGVVDIETGHVGPPNDQSVIHSRTILEDVAPNFSRGVVIPQAVIAA